MKVVINRCYGGFGLSEEAVKYLGGYEWGTYERGYNRDDPDLVRCVEELGTKADGRYAQLKVVEIPDGVAFTVEDYDGMEWVTETRRTWS